MTTRLAILLSALLAIPASAQDKPKPIPAHQKVDQEKVDEAIKKGCKHLLGGGQAMGTFPHGQRNQPQAIQAYGEIILRITPSTSKAATLLRSTSTPPVTTTRKSPANSGSSPMVSAG